MLALTENQIYLLALSCGVVVMLSFSIMSTFAVDVRGDQYKNFNTARKILGITLFLWSLYVISHIFFNLRFTNDYAAMSVSLATYYTIIQGFEMVLHTLLDRHYFSSYRTRRALIACVGYNILLAVNYFIFPSEMKNITILVLAIPLILEMCFTAYRANKRYREVRKNIEEYYSDDTSDAVVWMRNCIYIMLCLGFSSILIVYGSALSDAVTMMIAICVLVYLMVSMNNYIATINNVNVAIYSTPIPKNRTLPRPASLKSNVERWIAEGKFTTAGVTIEDLASEIKSNRTYVSDFINSQYRLTFRNWIAKLRIEYSQQLMSEDPKLHISTIAERVGYARSSFVSVFTKEVGTTPAKWREENITSDKR